MIGWLDDDDVSLTYSALRGEVVRHSGGSAEVVEADVFAALEAELAAGSSDDQWFGYFGYAARPDLPAASPLAVREPLPDAVWMRAPHVRMFEHPPGGARPPRPMGPSGQPSTGSLVDPPRAYAEAFARVQEHLHAGNSYEVNLTYRVETASDLDPASAYLRLRELNPAPYAGFLQHDVPGHRTWLLSSSPERYALVTADRTLETKPIKGTTPRGVGETDDAELRERLGMNRSSAPRT
jgi:para-aminobenzoate synthetase